MKNFVLFFSLLLFVSTQSFAQVVADFYATPTSRCNQPYEVAFFSQSQNDTALLWDFGDGNSSTLPQANHFYLNPGSYTISLIAYGSGGVSDTLVKANYVVITAAPINPMVSPPLDSVNCGASAEFVANGQGLIHWYNVNDNLVSIGDTLKLPIAPASAFYFARSEVLSPGMKVGPADPDSVGAGGYFNGNQGLVFDALTDIRIKSVLVDADESGQRTFTLVDTFGNILNIVNVFVPNGKSRVELNLDVVAGTYSLRGNGVGLFRNNMGGPAYPFEIPGLVSITGATSNNNFYYFFYDWEVSSYCMSDKVSIEIVNNPTPGPSVVSDTVFAVCGNSAQLIASAQNEVTWYDPGNNPIHEGDTLNIPFANASTTYYAGSSSLNTGIKVGPANKDSLGNGSFVRSLDDSWLLFDVYTDLTIESVAVEADIAGMRTILVLDINGDTIASFPSMLPAGKSRVSMDLDLEPGSYLMGGVELGLFRNENVQVDYPYSLPGILVITGSTEGREQYNYFYDWEIATLCFSELIPVELIVDQNVPLPLVSPTSLTVDCGDSAQFIATGINQISWYDQNNNLLHTGDTLVLKNLKNATNFYARDISESSPQQVGPLDGASVGGGGYFGFGGFAFIEFEVFAPIRLKSVWVDADGAGNRSIQLTDVLNNPLQTRSVNIPDGQGRINLDMEIGPGIYRLGGQGMDLFRNNEDADYPYSLPGQVSIYTSSAGDDFYYFFYDWEVTGLCQSDSSPAQVSVTQLPPPTVLQGSMTIPCKGSGTAVATGSANIRWYDANGKFISLGDTLQIPPITTASTFYARNETSGASVFGGPSDNSIGGGGFFQNDAQFLIMNINQPGLLRSVLVNAGSAGNRLIEYRDAGGAILDSVTVFIPAGLNRVSLNLDLVPGVDHQLAINGFVDLYRNNGGVNFPYQVGNYADITNSSAGIDFYYFFYDWEISEPGCQSAADSVQVSVTPIAPPTVTTQDTVCYNGSATFTASTAQASWFDPNGNFLGTGQNFSSPPLTLSGTYTARAESAEPAQNVGPLDGNSVGGGGYFDQGTQARLFFTVQAPLRLNSAWVDAGSDGLRDFVLEDAGGNPLQTVSVFVPQGQSRVNLGLDLQPGNYAIGGEMMNLFRNNAGAAYPYDIPGLLSITGSTAGGNFYYFLYDWEVQAEPCKSADVPFQVYVYPEVMSSFTYNQNKQVVDFMGSSANAVSWSWDFGDGNSAMGQNPSHTYLTLGTFLVTLTVSDGSCEGSFTDTVIVDQGVGIDDLSLLGSDFRLYPNPGQGQFTVEAETAERRALQIKVFDLAGREIYLSQKVYATRFKETIELQSLPNGTYMVQLLVDDARIMKKYVLMR